VIIDNLDLFGPGIPQKAKPELVVESKAREHDDRPSREPTPDEAGALRRWM
jgi:hypothetical protein